MKRSYLSFCPFYFFSAIFFGQTHICGLSGTFYGHSGNPVPYVLVVPISSGRQISGAASDHEGGFSIKPVSVGTCHANVSAAEFVSVHGGGPEIQAAPIHRPDIHHQSAIERIQSEIKENVLKTDQAVRNVDWDRETVMRNPAGSIAGMLPISAGLVAKDRGISEPGSRGPIQFCTDAPKNNLRPHFSAQVRDPDSGNIERSTRRCYGRSGTNFHHGVQICLTKG
jgi:hypothetical protein